MRESTANHGSYKKFFAMILTSTVAMFVLMYLHSYLILEHAWFSETRLFMTLIMGAFMTMIMLLFMRGMYTNARANAAILLSAVVLLGASVWLVRSQVTVDDVDYMEGMIPHHSIAILTSSRAAFEDRRVRALADDIVKAQRKEIEQMAWLIQDIRANGAARSQAAAEARPMPAASSDAP